MRGAAFTLAEVLITLGIIGVVAALTLPTLISNHKKQTYVNQLKKVVNTLENAAQMAVAQEGVSSFEDTSLYCDVFNFYYCQGIMATDGSDYIGKAKLTIQKYFKTTSISSIPVSYQYNNTTEQSIEGYYRVDFLDGAIMFFRFDNTVFYIDVNGEKGPNQMGRDMFMFILNASGHFIDGNSSDGYYAKIVSDGWKMNY